jgi:hypothetical protein
MNSTQSLQKRPGSEQPTQLSAVQPEVEVTEAHAQPLPPSHLQTCTNCDSPLDALQRYCLNCGTRSTYVSNPAVDFVGQKITASKRGAARLIPKSEALGGIGGTGVTKQAVPWLIGATLIALIVGIFIGSRNGNDELAAAIANQKAPVVNVSGGGGGPSAATAAPLTSDFTLDKGYTIQLKTIPSTSDQAAADAAKSAATTQGAADVGLINPTDYTIDPAPSAPTDYVIFSGQFEKKADATKAFNKLKKKFPDAKVVGVTAAAGSAAAGPVNDKTDDLSKFKPSAKKKTEDKAKVKDLNNKKGQDYVDAQDDLPDTTVIPADPNANTDPNALPGGD